MVEASAVSIRRREVGPLRGAETLDPLLARLYAARGVTDTRELGLGLEDLHSWESLGGIQAAADLLADAIARDRRLLVVGDYDCDGATATAVALLGLRLLGARAVDFLVPDRQRHGYGLTPGIVSVALERRPDLIITVDNGIASVAGVAAARAAGVQVLVTDHHLPGDRLPDADAIVNPNLRDDPFPSKALAGVGVMFYVLLALRAALRARGRATGEDGGRHLGTLLDLVALGTVADVARLDRNNRILVHHGLRRLRAGQGRPGLLALSQVAGRDPSRLTAQDLGFALGPRLNAAGRLADMQRGIHLLLTDDAGEAAAIARELDALNRERREVEAGMQADALAMLGDLGGDLPWGLCLHEPGWHAGVVGLVAARVKERVHRPVVAFAAGEDGLLKGSARSVPGLHVRDTLEAVATANPGLIERFGGHAMAAGLSLAPGSFPAFSAAFDAEVRRRLDASALAGVVWSDGPLAAEDHARTTVDRLAAGGPWGQGFPEPVFDGEFEVADARRVGERHLKLGLRGAGAPRPLSAIRFGWDGELPATGARLRLAYQLEADDWRGGDAVQLMVRHLEAV